MAEIVTRTVGPTAKGSPLTNVEVDNNFINLNTEVTPARPTIRPSLLLDFANSKSVDSRIAFTRASAATYYDDKGVLQLVRDNKPRIDFNPTTGECNGLLIEEQRTNLLTYSSEFNNAAWQKTRASIISNIIVAPDGTLTGDKLVEDTTAGSHTVRNATSVTIASGTTLTASAYFKAAEGTFATIGIGDGAGINISRATFNLSSETITVTYTANANVSTPITSFTPVGNGWYRCSVTATVSNVTVAQAWYWKGQNSNGTGSYTGDGNSGIYIWGAQLEVGAFPTSYTPTTATFTSRASSATYFDSTGILRTAGVNQARYGYGYDSASGKWVSQGLVLESAATNILVDSNLYGNTLDTEAIYTKTNNSTDVVAPDGSSLTTKLVTGTTGNTWYWRIPSAGTFTNGVTYTISVWLRCATGTTATWNLQPYPYNVSTLCNVTDQWQRFSVTFTMTSTTQPYIGFVSPMVSRTFYVWGWQAEAGYVATSYIPTYGSAATRAADVSSSAATTRVADVASQLPEIVSQWFNTKEGTLYGEYSTYSNSGRVFNIDNGTANQIALRLTESYGLFVRNNNNAEALISGSNASNGTTYKLAGAYKQNDFAHSLNGSLSIDTSGVVPTVNTAYFGGYSGGAGAELNGHIKKLSYYPKRLSNSELQALTK